MSTILEDKFWNEYTDQEFDEVFYLDKKNLIN